MKEPADSYEFLQLEAALLLAGCTQETVSEMRLIVEQLLSFSSGYQRLGKSLKSWKSTLVSILAQNDHMVIHERHDNYRSRCIVHHSHVLRRLGFSQDEISSCVQLHGKRKIPPFMLDPALVGALKPNPGFDVLARLVPLVNISRTGPEGGRQECLAAVRGFSENVTRLPKWSFDYQGAICSMLQSHHFRGSKRSRWEVTEKASREFPRRLGGKTGEFVDSYVNSFRYEPVSSILDVVSTENLYDITGALVLRGSEYSLDDVFCEVAYPDIGVCTDQLIDSRLGHLGLFWALKELRSTPGIEFNAEEDFENLRRGKRPTLRIVNGSIDARVTPAPEPGLKVRIITITSFFIALIGSVSRHCVDDSIIEMDETIRIGLSSKVKLYDWLVLLNARNHTGVSSKTGNSLLFDLAVSVDLTTATDTPHRGSVVSVLQGVSDSIAHAHCHSLFQLGVDLVTAPRVFHLPKETISVHNCGIMMGEGLAGIFLNVSSAFVRYSVREFMDGLQDYEGNSVAEADAFIQLNVPRIQRIIDTLKFDQPVVSIQSGDDVSSFGFESISRYLVLVYRTFGFLPSEGSWYESKSFLTFTEEIALRTWDSNGWTFVDTVKPRLFRPLDSKGETAVCSRIKQIGDSLRYMGTHGLRDRIVTLVDRMIDSCPSLSRVIRTCSIPVGLPTWLGGLGHPIGDEPGYLLTLDQRYRDILYYLSECDHAVLAEIFCVGSMETFEDGHRKEILVNSIDSMLSSSEVLTLDDLDGTDWIGIQSLDVPRLPYEKYSHWQSRKTAHAASLGLITMTEFCGWYQSVTSVTARISGDPGDEVPIARRLRKRQEFLFSILPDEYMNQSCSTDEDIFTVYKTVQSVFSSRYWKKDFLLPVLGLETQPTFSLSFFAEARDL